MITWIRENASLFSLLGGAVVIIATFAVGYHQLSDLVAAQPEIQKHLYDDSRHVDPEERKKQQEEMEDLKRRVMQLEAARWRTYIDRQRQQNDFRRAR
jgi:hypothetical protein